MNIIVVHWSIYKYDNDIKKIIKTEKHHKVFRFEKNDYRGVVSQEIVADQILDEEGLRGMKIIDGKGFGLYVSGAYTLDQYERIWGCDEH